MEAVRDKTSTNHLMIVFQNIGNVLSILSAICIISEPTDISWCQTAAVDPIHLGLLCFLARNPTREVVIRLPSSLDLGILLILLERIVDYMMMTALPLTESRENEPSDITVKSQENMK